MKVTSFVLGTALALAAVCGSSQAEDSVVAAALAKSAIKLNEEGKTEKARGLCYKSLANDENCADALMELGKILEQDGNHGAAADFYVRAIRVLGKDEAANRAKIAEAKNRLTKLNPYANQLTAVMSDYAADLGNVLKKNNDSLTKDETYDLNQNIKLDRYVGADKLPKFERGEITQPPAKTASSESTSRRRMMSSDDTPPPNDIPLEVEKALKSQSAGWTKITGIWKKKADNVYEVTNGRLEAEKLNGAIQCFVYPGGKGYVNVFVRNTKSRYEEDGFSSSYYASGYGYHATSGKASLFTPASGFSGNDFSPYMERDIQFPASAPKNHLLLTVDGNKIEYTINGKKEKTANYTIPNEGNFVIVISGTMIIEAPQTVGK